MSKNKMSRKRDVTSLFDSIAKDLYEDGKYEISEDDLRDLYNKDCRDHGNDDCDEDSHDECDDDSDERDEDCIEDAICDILKSQKKIMGCMEDMFCKLSKEIDSLHSPEEKVRLYKQLLCAYAKKDCSTAKLIKALAKLEKINNEKNRNDHNCRCFNTSPFRRC